MNLKYSTAYASAARTATPTAVVMTPSAEGKVLHLVINVTAVTSTPSVVPTIDYIDELSGAAYNILTGAAITATGTTVLKIGLGLTAAANTVANDALGNVVKLTMTHGNANSITYSVSYRIFE